MLVGLCFLVATFTCAIGSALIYSQFSSGASRDGTLVAGVFLLACTGLAVVTNAVAMRSVVTPHTIVAVGGSFQTSRTQWNASVLPVYAVSGAAGLILSSALWTSWLVPRRVSMLGLIGYPVFLVGTVLAMFNLIHVTHSAGMLALVPGGLFELILPIWLVANGFASPRLTP